MRSFYFALSLIAASCFSAYADVPSPNIVVLPHGSYFRGEYVEFSVLVDQNVRDLNEYDVRFVTYDTPLYLTISKSEGFFHQIPSVNMQFVTAGLTGHGVTSTSPGQYAFPDAYDNLSFFEVDRNPSIKETDQLVGLVAADVQFHQLANDTSGISGPGELYRNGLFVRLDAPNGHGTTDAPRVEFTNARDSKGNALALTTKTLPTSYDYRRFGDVNGDNRLDLKDVAEILRAATGVTRFASEFQNWYGDVYPVSSDGKIMPNGRFLGDGEITLADAMTALKVTLGDRPAWWPDSL